MDNYLKVTYTADNEDPKCVRCVHLGSEFDCENKCGPTHCWNGYKRETLEKVSVAENFTKERK